MPEFANYSVNGELLLDTTNFDKQIVSAADKLKELTSALETLNDINGLTKTIDQLKELSGVSQEDAKVMDELKAKYNEVGSGASEAGNQVESFRSKISSTVSAMARYNTQARTTYTTNLSTAQSFTRLGTLAQTAGKRIEGMTYMMRRLRSMGAMVATIFAWDMAMGMIQSTKATIEAKSEMESFYGILHMGTAQINSFNNTLDNTVDKFARINKFQLGSTLTSLAVEFDLTQNEMNKAANVVPMIMNEYLRAGRTTEEAVLAVKDIMQGEFMRLSRETGVGKEELQAAGWSGDTKDIQTLMTALEKVGNSRHWATFAAKANSLNDVILITENRFTEFAANITDRITPWVVRGFNGLIWAFDGLSNAYEGMSGFGQGVTQFLLWGSAIAGVSKIIMTRGIPALKEYVNARMANMMGLNAEVAKVNGIASAYAAASYAETAETAIKKQSTLAEYEKVAASQASAAGKEYEAMINQIATAAVEEEITADEALIIAKEELAAETARLNAIQEVETALMEELTVVTEETSIAESQQVMATELSVDSLTAKALALEAEALAAESNMSITEARNAILIRERIAELSTSQIIAAKILGLEAEAVAEGGVTGALYAKILGLEGAEAAAEAEAFATMNATEATKSFTAAVLSNPLFWEGAIVIGGVVAALYALSEATKADREAMSAYNEVLEDANNNLDQLPAKYRKIAENVKAFDDEYKKFLDSDKQYANERIYLAEKSMGLLTEEEQKYHELYGVASEAVEKLKEARSEIEAMTNTQVYVTTKYQDKALKEGSPKKEAKEFGEGMGGWEAWKKRSYEDYLQTDDFMIQLETLFAMSFADLGLRASGAFWDATFEISNINPYLNNFFSSIGTPLEENINNINGYLSQFTIQNLMNWWNGWSITDILPDWLVNFDIFDYIFTPVSAEDGSTGGGMTSADWARLLGLDETTIADIQLKLQGLVSTIKWWLNPVNWLTSGADIVTSWWNTNVADPLDSALSLLGIDLHIGGQKAGEAIKTGASQGSSGTSTEVKKNIDPIGGMLNIASSTLGGLANKLGLNIKSNTGKGANGTHVPVAQEMQDIQNSITTKSGDIWTAAYNTAKGIVDKIKQGLNRHSPGDSAKMAKQEMLDMAMFIDQSQSTLYNSAYNAGRSVVNGMNDANLSNMYNNQSLAFGINNDTLANTSNTYNQLNGIVGSSFNNMSSTINSTDMIVGNSLTNMANTAKSSYTDMANSTINDMDTISLSNEQYLNSMTSSTLSTTLQMTSAWNTMKNNIVNSANQIRSQSYSKFSSLHRSIASFYNQLATAHFTSGLVAGVPTRKGRIVGRVGRTSGNTGGRIKTAGGLSNIPQNHVNKIMNTAYPWKIADPWFLGIQVPMNNTVNDFKNGATKKVTYSNFESILDKVLTARGFNNPGSYDFYWNSQKTNQQVWDSVSCNCYDGAEMILEIANMLGLSGSIVNGSWNGIGHSAAMIGGKLYDMTQFQKHGVFRGTQGVVFGTNSGTSRHSAGRANSNNYSDNQTVVKHETTVHVDLSNSNIYGIDDLDEHIDKGVRKTIIELHGKNLATGY